ncbi:oryzin precursor [Hypoxylon trugodes]|uniref:oryzin precursor n=1 Tax=Hypoxylon trugodes TaxID=326681 RepID=UPI00219E9FBD|nr:oryzin precursor [Hypoxylon trugodes]KAI1382865.1 oryzin precursor [Hypoxylon trugodes]
MIGLRKLLLVFTAVARLTYAHPLLSHENDHPPRDAGRYIVTLRDGLGSSSVDQHIRRASSLHARSNSPMVEMGKRWNIGSWNAYSCTMDRDTLAKISTDEAVEIVEPDSEIALARHITQSDSPWGLGAISHRLTNKTEYVYDSRAGEGTYAYILDTGLLTSHDEFEGRASLGYNAVGGSFVDPFGHGTHVAGTIGGKTYGVAKKSKLISVKIFSEYKSYTSDLLDGYHWAVNNITGQHRQETSVISISAGGEVKEAVNRAVEEAYKQGILTIVSAGNSNEDAKNFSPASSPKVITVGAIGRQNTRSNFSNWGDSVDIFAPGERVQSAWIRSNQDSRSVDGTSMATPHISGLVLYLKSVIPYRMKSPDDSIKELKRLATSNVIINAKSSNNLLGFNGNGIVIVADD